MEFRKYQRSTSSHHNLQHKVKGPSFPTVLKLTTSTESRFSSSSDASSTSSRSPYLHLRSGPSSLRYRDFNHLHSHDANGKTNGSDNDFGASSPTLRDNRRNDELHSLPYYSYSSYLYFSSYSVSQSCSPSTSLPSCNINGCNDGVSSGSGDDEEDANDDVDEE